MAISGLFRYPGRKAIRRLLTLSIKELQKVTILYRLIWLMYSVIVMTANLVNSIVGS